MLVDDVAVELAVLEAVPDAAISPAVPLETAPGARLAVAVAARDWKAASERDAFLATLGHG